MQNDLFYHRNKACWTFFLIIGSMIVRLPTLCICSIQIHRCIPFFATPRFTNKSYPNVQCTLPTCMHHQIWRDFLLKPPFKQIYAWTWYKSINYFVINLCQQCANLIVSLHQCILTHGCCLCAVGECITCAMMLISRFKTSLNILFHICPLQHVIMVYD